MASLKTGTICTLRGSNQDWRIIRTQFDGTVNKYVIQSTFSGEIKSAFIFELFPKNTQTYKELNDFFQKQANQNLAELEDIGLDFFDDSFFFEEINAGTDLTSVQEILPPQPKRFKQTSAADVERLRGQTTEKTTDQSTKWAVGLLKGN